ncbi:unnamed protein product [Cuscuta campestris]|uniref:Uncharacterized protein n=1 Tax=Cuscuta campestris TaxID=132261 RepID=A0A484MJI4_9ASTE|nr:unnamed protein product [Cuscuta campestris]
MAQEFHEAPFLLPADVNRVDFWAEHSNDLDPFDTVSWAKVMDRADLVDPIFCVIHILLCKAVEHRSDAHVCGFVVTILFRSLVGSAPIPQPHMLMRGLIAGMLRNAHICKRVTHRHLVASQASASTSQADLTPDWAWKIMEQQKTINRAMATMEQQTSQAESFA